MGKTFRKTDTCSNCNASLSNANYCPECGQQNTTKNVGIGILVKDFIDDFFTLDSRLFKTIFPLLFKPGFLTLEYNKGKRIKYLPPLRMYLVLSVLFFILPTENKDVDISIGGNEVNSETKQQKITMQGEDVTVDFSLLKSNEPYKDSVIHSMWENSKNHWIFSILGENRTKNLLEESLGIVVNEKTRNAFIDNFFSNIPNMMFVLLPIFAFLLSLFFRNQGMLYVENLVFSLHFHSFFFFMLSIKQIITMVLPLPDLFGPLFILVLPYIYFVMALKNVYMQSYKRIMLKSTLIFSVYGMFLLCGLAIITLLILLF